MKRKIVSGIMLTLLFIGMLTLAFNIKPDSGTWSSCDDEQTGVASTSLTSANTSAEPRIWSSHDNEQSEVVTTSFATASGSAEVRFDPETYTLIAERGIGAGYQFNTTIELYDVTELFAWQIRAYFNNTLLNATNAYYYPDEPIHTLDSYMVDSPDINNDYNATHGYVEHRISAIYPNYVNVTAEDYPLGVGICIMEFEVLAKPLAGKTLLSDLMLDNQFTRLRKDPSTVIPCTKKNGLYRLISANIKVPIDYITIQAAINAADPGNTIFVYNGTYPENVVVNKTLMLMGQSAKSTMVNGSDGIVMYVDNVDDVTIDGFTISLGSYGIYIWDSDGGTISGCNITKNNDYGIYAFVFDNVGCDSWTIHGNNISGNENEGIYVYVFWYNSHANRWAIYDNEINANDGHGIYAYARSDTDWYDSHIDSWTVYHNKVTENHEDGIRAYSYSHTGGMGKPYHSHINGWIVYQNDVNQNGENGIYGYGANANCNYWTVSNNSIVSNGETGLHTLKDARCWKIKKNFVSSNKFGIHLGSENNILRGNEMSSNTFNFGISGSGVNDVDTSNTVAEKPVYYWVNMQNGQVPSDAGYIALVDSANITVANFSLSHNEQGILLFRTENVSLENINVGSTVYGIHLQESSNFTVYNSQAINNTYGIYLQDCANSTLSFNKAINNTYGIYLKDSAKCNITGTDIEANGYGVYLIGSSNNTLYHNNFNQNNQQAAIDGLVINVWDIGYPSGGNYWSDHTGPDWCKGIYQNETGSDGIVDANMTIDQNNIDYYPLSAPWSSPINIIMPGNTTYRTKHHLIPRNITLIFTVEFNASWIGYSLDGEANVTITGNAALTDLSCGSHYIIVYANDTLGNMYSSVKVHFTITLLTDINYDGYVDIDDLVETTWRYGSVPGDPRWNVYADVNRDGIIDIEDCALVIDDTGKSCP